MRQDRARQILVEKTKPFRAKRNLIAFAIIFFDSTLYLLFIAAALRIHNIAFSALISVAIGIMLARLFIVGHDCCHGAFFSSPALNRSFGRLVFLPTLTPYSLWELGHNVLHHTYPNLKGRDSVWAPLSKSEFDALSRPRRALERFYRSPYGLGTYYLVELWWKKLFFPNQRHVGVRRRIHTIDNLSVLAFIIVFSGCVAFGQAKSISQTIADLCFVVVIPFCVWNYLMGFVIYVHHTHPSIAWYDDRIEWSHGLPQIRNTVHVTFPLPFSRLLHNIMEHNAHHADINVPLYQLPAAQSSIEADYGHEIISQEWSVTAFRHCLRTCRLFDYQARVWLDFNGNITASSTQMSGK